MKKCFFVSDLHGNISRYEKLFCRIEAEMPEMVFFGGDLMPNHAKKLPDHINDFFDDFIIPSLSDLRDKLKKKYPCILLILGNDDNRQYESEFIEKQSLGLWNYMHDRKFTFSEYTFYGYAHVPPTPFLYKDWERYDVSRFVDPGCIPPHEGRNSIRLIKDIEFITIKSELENLTLNEDLDKSVFLFHSPPYQTNLDRAALDGVRFDHVPLDVNVGSIAIKRFIEDKQPYLTMHGHIHESTRITGYWMHKTGKTISFNAAHDGTELSVIEYDLDHPENAIRTII